MGASIAATAIKAGMPVKIFDVSAEALERGTRVIQAEAGPAGELLSICRDPRELAACDLVVESVVEDLEVKRQVLRQLAAVLRPTAILTTNTSTIRLAELDESVDHPERFCGMHFFVPVPSRPLVEIAQGRHTSSQTVAAAVAHALRIGKMPLVVRDGPGFLVNRLLMPYLAEAQELVCQGADPRVVDGVATRFGMALGPFQLMDRIGTDTAWLSGRAIWRAFSDRMPLTPLLPALVKRKRLGVKSGRGFYCYEHGDADGRDDPELTRLFEPYVRRAAPFSEREIAARLFLAMLVEATRLLDEQIVDDPQDVDFGLVHGLAFPAFRGGLMHWADGVGAARITSLLQQLAPLGKRFVATDYIMSLSESGAGFFRGQTAGES